GSRAARGGGRAEGGRCGARGFSPAHGARLLRKPGLAPGRAVPRGKASEGSRGTLRRTVRRREFSLHGNFRHQRCGARRGMPHRLRATELGGLAGELTARRPADAFQQGIRQFGFLMLRLTVFLVLFVMVTNVVFHRPWLESLLFALALAVGLTPELLPMVVSVTLANGARRLAQHRVIVKRLAAIHDLGAMDVLCTDKTGTLTEAKFA